MANSSRVQEIDPATGNVLSQSPLTSGLDGLSYGLGFLWATSAGGQLLKYDPSNLAAGPTEVCSNLTNPDGPAVGPDGNVYLADTESHSIRMIDVRQGTLEWIAGTGEKGDGPDGDPRQCRLARPHGIYVDRDGSIYIGDSENHRIRVIHRKAPPTTP